MEDSAFFFFRSSSALLLAFKASSSRTIAESAAPTEADPDAAIARIESHFRDAPCTMDYTDGLSVSCDRFRVNVRKSNTEPVLRLNVESRGDRGLMEEKAAEMVRLIEG